MEEKVILVNKDDEQLGLIAKMEAHEKGILHRAFSVFVFNKEGELLLQQRALDKYHSPGLWTNTCCSHQRDGESNIEAGKRRLHEEMGFDCELKELFSFLYKASFDNGLTEHELDHVMMGHYDEDPVVNLEEGTVEIYGVMNFKTIIEKELVGECALEWFRKSKVAIYLKDLETLSWSQRWGKL